MAKKENLLKSLGASRWKKIFEQLQSFYSEGFGLDLLIALSFSILFVFVVRDYTGSRLYPNFQVKSRATKTLIADKDYEIVDDFETTKRIQRVKDNVPIVFDYQSDLVRQWISKWKFVVSEARVLKRKRDYKELYNLISNDLDINLSAEELKLMRRIRYSRSFERLGYDAFSKYINSYIVDSKKIGESIEVVDLRDGEAALLSKKDFNNIYLVDEIVDNIANQLVIQKNYVYGSVSKDSKNILAGLLSKIVRANLTPNLQETEKRRDDQIESISPMKLVIKRGDIIVSKNQKVDKKTFNLIANINQQIKANNSILKFVAEIFLCTIVLLLIVIYFKKSMIVFLGDNKDRFVSLLILITSLALFRLTLIFVYEVLAQYFENIPKIAFLFLIPVAAPAMIIRFLIHSRSAVMISAMYAVGITVMLGAEGALFGFYVLMISIIGAMTSYQVRTRAQVYKGGLITAFASASMSLFLLLLWQGKLPNLHWFPVESISDTFSSVYIVFCTFSLAFAGGFFSALVTLTLTPILEYLLDYTTDLKLLELARMDHPLMRELIIKAPGTYHHSIVVGSLSEEAAKAIGADSLLARVGSYYHDIGKTERPEYFTENQMGGENRHDQTSPQMSAKIIISHVKKGVVMAKSYRLGQVIIDCIEQHHGTTLVKFFHHKAIEEAKENGNESEVQESDYRYPGPRPQNKVTAILSLADACEAATRSLLDPSPSRIEAIVDKIIRGAHEDGNLDEADVTFRELSKIREAFVRILLGIHHQRVQYPDQEEDLPEPGEKKLDKKLSLVKKAK